MSGLVSFHFVRIWRSVEECSEVVPGRVPAVDSTMDTIVHHHHVLELKRGFLGVLPPGWVLLLLAGAVSHSRQNCGREGLLV